MIEINLLPGSRKAKRSRSASIDFRAMFGDLGNRIRDPWLITAVVGLHDTVSRERGHECACGLVSFF